MFYSPEDIKESELGFLHKTEEVGKSSAHEPSDMEMLQQELSWKSG